MARQWSISVTRCLLAVFLLWGTTGAQQETLGHPRRLLAAVAKCTHAGQFVPDTSVSCTKYWQCTADGQGAYQTCPAGTAWDTATTSCNFKNQVKCGGGGTPSPSPRPSSPSSPTHTPSTPSSGSGIGSLISSDTYSKLFAIKDGSQCQHPNFYTYKSFIAAASTFPGFGTSKNAAINKREVAAFLAQISHETTGGGDNGGLCFDEEKTSDPYCAAGQGGSSCAPGQTYHGRGPIQLSWNYNYGPAGKDLGFDGIKNPGAVLKDATLAWRTAIRFWMTSAGAKPSCHDVMTGKWQPSAADSAAGRKDGFGTVTNIINGGIECGPGRTNSQGGPDRIRYFKRYVQVLGTDTGSNLSCDNSKSFAA